MPRGAAVHREFERLYCLARTLRPTSTDRWNGDLLAGSGESWGSVDKDSGAITLSAQHVLRHLRGSGTQSTVYEQAQALATVLHESTHAGMEIDAPTAPNAVRMNLIWNVMEGVAELRAMADVQALALLSGYGDLPVPTPQYPAPHAAIEGLITLASGPRKGDGALLDDLSRGPGVLHLDCLADGVLQNRLADVVPLRDRLAIRAALIQPMLHPAWSRITKLGSTIGEGVAQDIQIRVNSTVDEIRHHYQSNPRTPYPAEAPNPAAIQLSPANARTTQSKQGPPASGVEMRFLDGQAPAARATSFRPDLGQGARGAGSPTAPKVQRPAERRWE
ncbi:hypothetical protein HDA39_003219 [Kribbella italica]|uniref:Uncharacterized protein n=1 Tax=Kribbella italica TaxID=1540520 RepID=A0A7W9J7C3_9ACTN|nr:hypothetical protein [Kribbella italica]